MFSFNVSPNSNLNDDACRPKGLIWFCSRCLSSINIVIQRNAAKYLNIFSFFYVFLSLGCYLGAKSRHQQQSLGNPPTTKSFYDSDGTVRLRRRNLAGRCCPKLCKQVNWCDQSCYLFAFVQWERRSFASERNMPSSPSVQSRHPRARRWRTNMGDDAG